MNSNRMKAVLLSIKPKWCELIANGRKTIEVRKTKPKIDVPFKVYIYCTKGENLWKNKNLPFIAYNRIIDNLPEHLLNGKVIGEFVCNNIDWHGLRDLVVKEDAEHTLNDTCLTEEEVLKYLGYQKGTNIYACKNYDFYGWHISNLIIYDKPKEIDWFRKPIDCRREKNRKNCMGCWDCEIKRPPQDWCYIENGGS